MELIVDPEKCITAGECILRAPEIFGLNEQTGKAELLKSVEFMSDDLVEDIVDAVESCPVGAITFVR